MRPLLLCGVLALGLSACNGGPVVQIVPTDPLVLNGHWSGSLGCENSNFPVDIYSNATYIDKTTYKVEGELIFRGTTYNFDGIANALVKLSFAPVPSSVMTAQTTGQPQTMTNIKTPLLAEGKVVGSLLAFNYTKVSSLYYMDVSLVEKEGVCIGDVSRAGS